MLQDRLLISLIFFHIPVAVNVLERPEVFHIEKKRRFGGYGSADDRVEPSDIRPGLRHFGKYARVFMADVVHDGPVELLGRTASLPELEILHGIRPVRDGLLTDQLRHAWPAELADRLPVGGGRGGLHHKEGLPQHTPEPVVLEGGFAEHLPVGFVILNAGIIIPADDIQFPGEAVIVHRRKKPHEVRRTGHVRRNPLQGFDLRAVEVDILLCRKPLPRQVQRGKRLFSVGPGGFDLRPVGIGVRPERRPPGGV